MRRSGRQCTTTWALAAILALGPTASRAGGIPVIDVAAIAQLVDQIGYWQRQVAAMSQQLLQLQQTHAAITGTRGMQALLPMSNLQRNYLPPDYAELMRTVDGSSTTYAGLSAQVQSAMAANAILTNAQLGALTPEMRETVESGRRASAMLTALSRSAYQNTSQRFAALQTLVSAIGMAADAKAIEDLQGRIAAEQAMLTNEQTKLQTLYRLGQTDQLLQQQRTRELVVLGHGGFASRFAPTP